MTPFSGAGSECVAAKLAERTYLGYEIEKEYYDMSIVRLSETEPSNQLSLMDFTSEGEN